MQIMFKILESVAIFPAFLSIPIYFSLVVENVYLYFMQVLFYCLCITMKTFKLNWAVAMESIKSRWNQSVQLHTKTGSAISIDFRAENVAVCHIFTSIYIINK